MYEVHNTVPQINSPPWAAIAFAFEVSHSTNLAESMIDCPMGCIVLHYGDDVLVVLFHSTNIINGGVYADTQFPPFSESSAS